MLRIIFIYCLAFPVVGASQAPYAYQLKLDSCALSNPKNKEAAEMIDVKIKNNYQIQFIKQNKLTFLKIIVRDDLGFGKKGSLQLLSGKKQIYIKSIKLEPIDKTSAYFILELNNTYYLENIKELGLSRIVFNETAEFTIPKGDSDQIKKAADCFSALVKDLIWPPIKKP